MYTIKIDNNCEGLDQDEIMTVSTLEEALNLAVHMQDDVKMYAEQLYTSGIYNDGGKVQNADPRDLVTVYYIFDENGEKVGDGEIGLYV